MTLKSASDKLTFIIDSLCTIGMESKGGTFAIHKLAYELAEAGHFVYLFNTPLYSHENIYVIPTERFPKENGWWSDFTWDGFSFDKSRTISIYTQLTWGNPFNTTHNCRWILNDYDEAQWKTFGENDFIYNFGTFKIPNNVTQSKLTILDYKTDVYFNLNLDRKGFCYIIHKFTPDWGYSFLENFGAKNLSNLMFEGKFEELCREFNKHEYMITFDYKSYITTAAALCGCKVVILNPNRNVTPLQFRIENPLQMCGVAYGWDDLAWAEKTVSLVKDNLTQLTMNDKKSFQNFLNFWESKIFNQ